jgi:hypothetical protein
MDVRDDKPSADDELRRKEALDRVRPIKFEDWSRPMTKDEFDRLIAPFVLPPDGEG